MHLSTWKEVCGIASYTEGLVDALQAQGLQNEVYAISRKQNKYMTRLEIQEHFEDFYKKAIDCDIVHIQHEFGFFGESLGTSLAVFFEILRRLRILRKPVVVTFHSEPTFVVSLLNILGSGRAAPRHLRRYFQTLRWRRIAALFKEGRINNRAIVHTKTSRLSFITSGFSAKSLNVIPLGIVKRGEFHISNTFAKEKLGYPSDSILLSLFGFISSYKGPEIAVKALTYLPENYHLALIGRPHPEGKGDQAVNLVLKLLGKYRQTLKNRVRITGFVDGETLDLYHAATDICLAPYRDVGLSSSAAITWALSSGKPVVASNIPAFKEITDFCECMSLVSEGADYELAWHIENLVMDTAKQERLVQNARLYARANDWSNISASIVSVYKNCLVAADSTGLFKVNS